MDSGVTLQGVPQKPVQMVQIRDPPADPPFIPALRLREDGEGADALLPAPPRAENNGGILKTMFGSPSSPTSDKPQNIDGIPEDTAPFEWMEKDANDRRDSDEVDEEGSEDFQEYCFPAWHHLSTTQQWIAVNILAIVILLPIALISYFAFNDRATIAGVTLTWWCIFIEITVFSLALCRIVVWAILEIWRKKMRQLRWIERIELIESLQGWITLACWSLVNYGLWISILQYFVCRRPDGYIWKPDEICLTTDHPLTRIFLGIVFTSIAFFFKSYSFHSFVRSFHQVAYSDRLAKLKFAQYVLDTLREARHKASKPQTTQYGPADLEVANAARNRTPAKGAASEPTPAVTARGHTMIDVLDLAGSTPAFTGPEAPTVPPNLGHPVAPKDPNRTRRPLYQTFIPQVQIMDVIRKPFDLGADEISTTLKDAAARVGIIDGPTPSTKGDAETQEAKKFAKKTFEWLCPEDKAEVTLDQFLPVFPKVSVSKKAFAIFDKNGSGKITSREMKQAVVEAFDEQRHLSKSIHDMHHALTKLSLVLTIFTVFLLIFVWLLVFGVNLANVFVTLTTLLVIASYVIGGSLSATFSCVIFLFVTHPYDVGDVVQIQQVGVFYSFTILEMNVLTTVAKRDDGLLTIMSNALLSTLFIYNVRRSAPMSQSISFYIPIDTDINKIYALQKKLAEFQQKESVDYSSVSAGVSDMDGSKYLMKLWVSAKHTQNWQDASKTSQRQSKFVTHLKELLQELSVLPAAVPAQQEIILGKDTQKAFESAFGHK